MKAWFDLGGGRQVYRSVPKPMDKPAFPCPRILREFSDPVQSMADGKFYTSKTALASSYKASGNPRGEEFVEIGNEEIKNESPEADPIQRREHIKHAMHDVISGNLPPEIAAIE